MSWSIAASKLSVRAAALAILCGAGAAATLARPAAADVAAPAAHTKPPTVAEFDAVEGEVTVLGSSALACQTKAVREWVRISCRGVDKARGKPTDVTVQNANGAEHYKAVLPDRTSLIYRFEAGAKVEATFKWERLTKKFLAEWPAGAPKPTAYGKFL